MKELNGDDDDEKVGGQWNNYSISRGAGPSTMEERRGGRERGHLRTSGDIWPPFKGQVGPSFGSYNLQPILGFFITRGQVRGWIAIMELDSCEHWSLKLEHVTLQLWICLGTFGRNFRDKWGHNFAAIICSQYLGEFYPSGGGCELKSCKPWSLTGYYCIQMECVTLDRIGMPI